MKIKSKIAIRFTIIVGAILLIFAFAIYYLSANYRSQEFYSRLNEKATNTAKLLLEIDEVSSELLKTIGRNTITLPNEEIIIFDYNYNEIFRSSEVYKNAIAVDVLKNIKLNNGLQFKIGENEGLGILYKGEKEKFLIIAVAYDKYGFSKLNNLKIVLLIGFILCVLATMLAGWFFAGQALNPISKVIEQVDKITALNLNKRVDEGNGTDEIAKLAITFNQMLNRIEKAFELQKSFVSNASHELRTPLTSITGQLEVALMKDRSREDYIETLNSVLEDIRSMNRLSNGLLDLAQANLDISKLAFNKVRIDELLWSTRNELLKRNVNNTIAINVISFPDDENKLVILGSEQLLRSAITNIIENACKFSGNKTCNIDFLAEKNSIKLLFTDNGIGISDEEQKNIFQPFFRASNAKTYSGYGIGLSLTQKIIAMHKGEMLIESKLNQYTKISIVLPC